MKNISLILLSLVFLTFLSCQNEKTSQDLVSMFNVVDSVKSQQTLASLNSALLKPTDMVFTKDGVFVLEEDRDTLITYFDNITRTCKTMLTRGQSETEVVRIYAMGAYGDDGVFVYDGAQRKVVTLNNNLSLSSKAVGSHVSNVVFDGRSYISQNVCNDSLKCHFSYVDEQNTIDFSPLHGNDMSATVLSYILQGVMTVNGKSKRMFWGNSIGDYYEIYDYSDIHDIKTIISQKNIMPETQSNSSVMTYENHLGIVAVTSSNDYIYALYCGRTLEEAVNMSSEKDKIMMSNTILVFNWDGQPVKVLITDNLLSKLYFNMHDNTLYGIGLNEDEEFCISKIQ